jgi:hypothetical protein
MLLPLTKAKKKIKLINYTFSLLQNMKIYGKSHNNE